MGFFKKLFGPAPPPRSAKIEAITGEIKNAFLSYTEEYAEQLRACRLPVPEQGEFHTEITKYTNDKIPLELKITLPVFTIPKLIFLRLRPDRFCTIVGSEEELEKLENRLSQRLTLTLILKYSMPKTGTALVWTSRHPYSIYKYFSGQPVFFNLNEGVEDALKYFPNKVAVYRFEKARNRLAIPAWNEKEIDSYEERLGTFLKLTNDVRYFPTISDHYNFKIEHTAATVLTDQAMESLPIFGYYDFGFKTSSTMTMKIIPQPETKPALMRQFFESLSGLKKTVIFSLSAAAGTVSFNLRHMPEDRELIDEQMALHFPDYAVIRAKEPERYPHIFGIYNRTFIPQNIYKSIKTMSDFHIDPYRHLCEVLSAALDNTREAHLEIWCKPFSTQAVNAITNFMAHNTKDHYIKSEWCQETLKLFQKKLPVWGVTVKWIYESEEEKDYSVILNKLKNALRQYENVEQQWTETHIFMDWSIYSVDELVSLAHFPTGDLNCDRLEIATMKAKLPPPLYAEGETRIGVSEVRGQRKAVFLPEEVRDRHVYLVGKSGTGKSTLLEAIARADILSGRGLAVVDPHGDLINHLLETIPRERVEDCVYFSPKLSPVSLDILSAETEHEIDLLSDDLITMFRRTSEAWGDRMQAILQMAFQTLLRVPGSSFTDLTPLLTDETYRRKILSKIDHPQLASFWERRYDMRQAEPILIRMDRLTTSRSLRYVLTQNAKSLNFADVISEGKIFLADLSKGFLGESTSHLLGSIIVSQIQLAAMRQTQLPAEQRIPFSLFVDEVQNFTTDAFGTILSEARKQKLRLTVAHQFVSQLPVDMQKAVFGNVGTLIFFALSPDDLGAARHELGTFEAADVANLAKYHALCRPATAARDTFSFATDPPPAPPAENFTEAIIEHTRREYGDAAAMSPATAERQPPDAISKTQNEELAEKTIVPVENRRPLPAQAISFATNGEKILFYLRQAEYLSQPQIIALTGLQASNASTALKKLVETAQIKSLDDRRPKIYFVGRTCNVTTHNLLIRDLLVKIYASGFAVRAVKFNEQLPSINPDLSVEFIAEDGSPLVCYFEIDRGTEGVQELARKADRYARLSAEARICFVFEREQDMQLARTTIQHPFIAYAVLDQFASLRDEAFYSGGADSIQLLFFR